MDSSILQKLPPAICHGGEVEQARNGVYTLTDVFQRVKEQTDNHGILYVNEEGHEQYRSYDELVGEAGRMLSGLRGLGLKAGDKVILQFDRQEDFVTVFWGCIIGGIVPVPMTTSKDYREKSNEASALYSVWEMLDKPVILTSGTLERGLMEFSQNYGVNSHYIQAIEKMKQTVGEEVWHISKPEDLALMLFTSGSTGKPKGVQLTHGNIIAREKGTVQLNGFTPEDISLNWMPLEHVGGLVMFHIRDMYTGCQQIQVKIERILTDPRRWMDLISAHRCTVTWAPNFAYGLVTESVESRGGNEAWDLSTMRFILNGGEQITPRTGKRFLEVLSPYGLRSDCMNPAWGMSETCSGVVYSDVFALGTEAGIRHVQKDSLQGRIEEAKPGEEAFTFVEIGRPIPGVSVRIVDHDRNVISEERIGRIQLNGECVTKGYYNNPELNQEMFDEVGWFETGDVGFIRQGRLTITGRSKEEIIINGINISNYEVEAAIERLEGVETSYTAVCALEEKANKESVLIFFVPKEGTDPVQQIQKIKGIVSKGYGIKPKEVIPVRTSQIPKTSIGKIQRKKLVEQFKQDAFQKIIEEYKNRTRKHAITDYRNEYDRKVISICKEVLKSEDISIHDDLFELGASSIEFMQLISKIHIEFGIRLEVSDLFRTASLEHLADYLQSKPQSEYQSVKKVNTSNSLYSSSASQKRMFAANQLDTGLTYNVTTAFMIEGAIDSEKLNMAFNMLVDRHETLRSSFAMIDGQIRQYVHSDTQITIRYAEVPYQNIDQIINAFIHPFNLAESPLLRVTLVNYEPERYVLIMDGHHIIMDGASVDIMLNEVFSYYNGEQLSEITVHQKDFIEHMNQIPLEGSEAEKFWMTMFEGEIPLINLSTDYPRPVYQKFEGRKIRFTLTGQMLYQLKEMASRSGTTLYMILLSTYYVLLNKYTNQEDIVIGTLFSGRTHPDIEKCIGMFINTVPLRNYPVATKPFIRFMNEVEECVLQAMRHQHYPFENVMENLSLERNMSRNPMFDTVFIMHEEPFKEVVGDDFQGHKTEFHNKTSRVDLTLEAMILNGELILEFEYSTNLFREETIQRMANHFQNTLKAVLREPEIPLCKIDVLSQTDKYALLKQSDHNEACSDPPVVGFMELFKQAVSLNPDYTAVVFKENEISYADLDLKSSQLAVTLQRNGVDTGTRVGIMVESGFEAIVSMLAVIKAKGTFLLVDPHYPMERKRYMLDDSNVSLLLSRETDFAGYKVHNISDASLYDNDGVVSESISPNDPAYIMYTSGSSGRPKGVLINHNSLNYFIRDFSKNTAFDTNASIVSMTSVSFDPFIVETLLPLAKGMRVVVAEPDAHRNLKQLSDLMLVNEVDILQTTPSRLKVLMGNHSDYFQQLKLILIGGEHFDNGLLNKLKEITDARIFNIYGPTETTVWSATKELTESGRITIGKPLEHMSYYILNNYLNLVPIGVEGELCISGSGLSEGYLNNAELSEAKFVLNPFRPNELIYRSGDYAKILENGEIELIGRHDDQVKIRGHRIELREIENNVSNHDLVNEAVVLTPELPSGEKTVCVYYVAKNELDLRTFLSDILPAYMMPNYFIRLESLPLTVNGKLDRKRLPLPTVESISENSSVVLVANEREEVILSIWKEILEINHCDLGHSFFELGGHSLNGLLVITRLNRIFNVDLELRDLFENGTVSKLSALIDAKKGGRIEAFPPIEQCLPSGHYRLSFAQARMYTVHQLADIPTAYNVPHMYKISDDVEYSRLQEAFAQVIQRHSVFRTSFEVSSEGIPVQRIHEHVPFKLEYKKLHNQTLDEAMNEFVRPFDLEKAPLLRAQLVETDNRESVLFLDVHHIIIDAASMMIMLKDLIEGYKGNKLSEPSVDYKDYCLWEERILHMPRMKRQEEYWLTKYEPSRLLGLELPTDFTRPTIQSFAGDCITFELDKSLTNRLKSIALATDSTLFMVLLSAYKSLLFIYSNQTDIVVGTPVSGRWQAELNDVIGMFANTVVIQSHIDAGQPFANLVQTVRSNTMQAFSNQEYPFDRLVDKLKTGRGAGRNPLFDVMFVLQTVNFSKHELEGMPIEYMHYNPLVSKFDLLIQAYEDKGSIHFMLDYSTKLFKRETIQKMVDYFNVILESVAQDMNIILSDIEVVSEEERQRLLNFNEAGNYDF